MDIRAPTEPGCDARASLDDAFCRDVIEGLSHAQKAIPARWFYDHRGSELFEEITRLPEYYLTGAEIEILSQYGEDIAGCVGTNAALIEFGAGSATKTPLLIDQVAPSSYVPIDISGEFLRQSCAALQQRYPALPIIPVEADFTQPVTVPAAAKGQGRLGFFSGSTIGNFEPAPAVDLLRSLRSTLGPRSYLLIGMDLIKDQAELEAAYDDSAGVTAAFNLNLAERINRELDGTIPIDALRHRAIWNDRRARIEMHLEAVRDMRFEVRGRMFAMRAGETIHTESSHKHDFRSAMMLLLAGGWDPQCDYRDDGDRFMVVLARAADG